jgi:hypothetical protein
VGGCYVYMGGGECSVEYMLLNLGERGERG